MKRAQISHGRHIEKMIVKAVRGLKDVQIQKEGLTNKAYPIKSIFDLEAELNALMATIPPGQTAKADNLLQWYPEQFKVKEYLGQTPPYPKPPPKKDMKDMDFQYEAQPEEAPPAKKK